MRSKIPIIYSAVLLGCLLFSLFLFLFVGNTATQKVMFFPDSKQNSMTGELRYIVRRNSKEDMVRKYLQELILGPERIDLHSLLPKKTKLRGVILRGGNLYIDFNEGVLFQDSDTPFNYAETLEILESALLYNFHSIKKITVTVNGQQPRKKNKSR